MEKKWKPTESWFFEKLNKIHKPLNKLAKRMGKRNLRLIKLEMNTTDVDEFINHKDII